MRTVDSLVCLAYLVLIAVLGHRAARRTVRSGDAARDAEDFHLAGRTAGGMTVGLSVMVTAFSASNFVLFPSEVAGHGLYVAACLPVFVLVAWPVMRWAMPFFNREGDATAYACLERRHGRDVRRLASALFLLWRLLWMGLTLLAAARFLAQVTGWGVAPLIVATALVATAYTSVGGLRAVLWTDVAQFVVLFGAIIVATAVTSSRAGGLLPMLETVRGTGGFAPFVPWDRGFLSWDPRIRITLGSAVVGTFVAFLSRYVADQSVVQRYLAAKSLAAARRGFVWNVAGALLSIGWLLVLGLAVRANAAGDATLAAKPAAVQLGALMRALPAGALGVVTAGLLAATMSSLDSGLHSCTTSLLVDWQAADARGAYATARKGRWTVLVLGFASALLALAAQGLGDLFVLANRVVNGMGSPLLALMLGAMLPLGATARGLFWGTLAGTAASVLLTARVEPLAMHHYATLNFAVTALCIGAVSRCDRGAGLAAQRSRNAQSA